MTDHVRILALLGSSPAVLTEFLYWVATKTLWKVQGVEVWLTQGAALSSYESLKLQLNRSAGGPSPYERLASEVGPEAAFRLPEPLTAAVLDRAVREGVETSGWRFHLLKGPEGQVLEDVRDDVGTQAAMRQLYDRIRELEASSERLIGLLSGGRKTMSSAMHAAYTLRARQQDALYHVLVSPKIEDNRELLKEYDFPNDAMERRSGVPKGEQVAVSAVPFAPTMMMERAPAGTWDQEWGRWTTGPTRMELTARYLYIVASDGTWARLRLSPTQVALLGFLKKVPEGCTADEIATEVGKKQSDVFKARDAARQLVRALRDELARLPMAVRLCVSPVVVDNDQGKGRYRLPGPDVMRVVQALPKLPPAKERPDYVAAAPVKRLRMRASV
jgi:CRISPR-associated protein (TIGR02584 family)